MTESKAPGTSDAEQSDQDDQTAQQRDEETGQAEETSENELAAAGGGRAATNDAHSDEHEHGSPVRSAALTLVIGALGVVFGDIGTSPLYALQTVFSIDNGAVRPTEGDVYGVVSLMFWSITIVVSIKYVSVVMRADNQARAA